MAAKKKDNPLQQAVETILKKNGGDYNEWKKAIINQKKLAVMSDEDKEWTERTIHEASMELVMESVIKSSDQPANSRSV